MELYTTLNEADVRVVYEIETDDVDYYDHITVREHTKVVAEFFIEAVWFQGINIKPTVCESDLTALSMECEASYREGVAV
jgi:hypothetical protein